MQAKTVLITGAAGNLGVKLRRHLEGRFDLRLLDIDPKGDEAIRRADLSQWDTAWVDRFRDVEVVVHLAADPTAQQSWSKLVGPNVDAMANVFEAAAQQGLRRIVYASSNHVMGGYKDDQEPLLLTTETPPRPGTRYVVDGEQRDSSPYGSAKLFGERLGKCYADARGLSVVAVRIGWVRPEANLPEDVPHERGPWFRLMWLSNRDYCHLMERCIVVDRAERFVVVNGMSANTGMRWDIEHTRRVLGYEPKDDVTRPGPKSEIPNPKSE
ncbi:MAG: NAD(P)-dependent oxidoreductase [Planctomycetes bacterium]|nr:NAD(P)-dependent oxidoreductase [Planctomycetota bacterium]